MPGEPSGDQIASRLKDWEDRVKAEGFTTVGELVGAYQSACADRDKAVAARDKFNAANDEAQKIIRGKAGEIGQLKQELAHLKAAQGTEPQAPQNPAPPQQQQPGAPVKTVDESLAEIEAGLTDEQWQAADALLEKMTDEEAVRFTNNKKDRLEFLTGLKNDPAMQVLQRPKSFRPQAPTQQPPADGKSAYELVMQRIRGTVPGPSGSAGAGRTGNPANAGKRPVANWLN